VEAPVRRLNVLDGLQGNVLLGYGTPAALYLFTRVRDAGDARRWLDSARVRITTHRGWEEQRSETTLNAAFTYTGLTKLEVPDLRIEHLTAFKTGMHARHEQLGDVEASAAEHWQPELREHDMLLVLTAGSRDRLRDAADQLRASLEADAGFEIVLEQAAERLPGGAEHFGFSDGFSQPAIDGVPGSGPRKGEGTLTKWGYWRTLALGEFVLGHRDEGGLFPPAPLGPLGDDSTFMVVRKLAQDVIAFRRYIEDTSARIGRPQQWLRAKMVGRWDNGSALARYPHEPGPPASRDRYASRFQYGDDPEGLHCPRGAHIRRANPRDSHRWQGRLTQRHRIIRRGMSYGEPLPPAASSDDGQERGLMFVSYQADIERQFEFIQQRWLADGNALELGSDADPLVAGEGGRDMVIPGEPPVYLSGIPNFVRTRGGAYYLLPGAAGLRALATRSC
jgi:Dyp-type peroxidase family